MQYVECAASKAIKLFALAKNGLTLPHNRLLSKQIALAHQSVGSGSPFIQRRRPSKVRHGYSCVRCWPDGARMSKASPKYCAQVATLPVLPASGFMPVVHAEWTKGAKNSCRISPPFC